MHHQNLLTDILSWILAIFTFAIGIVNLFWGNDPGFGAFLLLLSIIFIPPINSLFKKITGFSIPWFVKVIVAIFIIWAALGVGELFDKVELMLRDLQ